MSTSEQIKTSPRFVALSGSQQKKSSQKSRHRSGRGLIWTSRCYLVSKRHRKNVDVGTDKKIQGLLEAYFKQMNTNDGPNVLEVSAPRALRTLPGFFAKYPSICYAICGAAGPYWWFLDHANQNFAMGNYACASARWHFMSKRSCGAQGSNISCPAA